jgi:DNA (cytosine-5)-methyltransferase 1
MRVVDLFSGFGGATLGATQAGARVVYAANHWQTAIDVHSANHPGVRQECQDLRQANWTALPEYDLLWGSPACQGHSTAGQPKPTERHDADRQTAWAVVDCAEATLPEAIIVENVLKFSNWVLYPLWKQALERLGYSLREHRILATDHGVPQLRNRLFVVGLRRGRHFTLPLSLKAAPAFGPHLEPTADGWRPIADAPDDTRGRLLAARRHIGSRALVHHVTGHRGIALSEPIRTITTKAQWTLQDDARYRWITKREVARAQGFPDSFTWPTGLSREVVLRGFGNAVPPAVARDLVAAVERAVA